MHQQHGTGQARRCGHFLLEVEQDVARVVRVVILHLVAEDELVGEVHRVERAVLLWRGLGYQAADTAPPVAGDVVPDHLQAAFGDRERHSRAEVVQAVATFHQGGFGGVFLDGREHISRDGRAAMGFEYRDLEGVRVALEHGQLAWRKLVFVLLGVLRGDGEQRLLAAIWIGQEALAVDTACALRQRLPRADRAIGVTGLFGAHRGQGTAQLGRLIGRYRSHHAGRQQGQAQYTGLQQTSGLVHVVSSWICVLRSSRQG